MRGKTARIILIIIVLGIIAGGIAFAIWFFSGEDEASRDAEAAQLCSGIELEEGQRCFVIVASESEVRFELDEELQGEPVRVAGRTSNLAGEILIDVENPSNSQVGEIEINLRELETDNEFRDRAIRREILQSSEAQYEFTTFIPTAVENMPDSVTVGEEFTFTVTGELTLVDTTNSVTFEVTVTPVSESRIEGVGQTMVLRSDYGLQIPEVQGVANVSDEVDLFIDFVAVEVSEAPQPEATPEATSEATEAPASEE